MHDKQVRRRRAVLGLLVGVSLILLTAYFGESPSSPLHTVQRGIVEVLSPVQAGASKVLSPVRDIAGWFSDTFNAKSENARLRRQNAQLTRELAADQQARLQNAQLTRLVGLDQSDNLSAYGLLASNVIGQDPTVWYDTIEVDKGYDDGVRVNDPVIAGAGQAGLVGKVTNVGANYAMVTELNDHTYAVGARVFDSGGDAGLLQPAVGNPTELLLTGLPSHAPISVGQQVVTSGFKDLGNPIVTSLYPPGIPIGTVSNANQDTLANSGEVQVQPLVDLRHLTVVQILTRATPSNTQRAQLGTSGG